MNAKRTFALIVITIILSLLANVFFGRWLTAKISTLPVLNRFKILSPQTPIVINNQQVTRVSDSTDLMQAENSVSSKLSAVAVLDSSGNMSAAGAAVNLTSDGLFVTGNNTFGQSGQKYFVVLSDGTTAAISTTTEDAATGLVFFRAAAQNISPADLGNSGDLLPGEKLVLAQNSLQGYMTRFDAGFVSQAQGDVEGLVFDSDKPSRGFGLETDAQLTGGEAVVNLSGQVVGVYSGQSVISSDVVNQDISLYLSGAQKIIHPVFGFTYSIITKTQNALTGLPQGAQVKSVKSRASVLEEGDIITSLDGNAISESNPLEPLLENYKAGDNVKLIVIRNQQTLNLTLKVQ